MYKNAIKMLGRAIFERFFQIFGVFIPKTLVFFWFSKWCFFGVLRFPFGVFGPKLSGHTGNSLRRIKFLLATRAISTFRVFIRLKTVSNNYLFILV